MQSALTLCAAVLFATALSHTVSHEVNHIVRDRVKAPRTAALSFRIDAEMKDALERAATEDSRSVSSLIIKILTDWLRERGYLPK